MTIVGIESGNSRSTHRGRQSVANFNNPTIATSPFKFKHYGIPYADGKYLVICRDVVDQKVTIGLHALVWTAML
jgi:hypothetical protein